MSIIFGYRNTHVEVASPLLEAFADTVVEMPNIQDDTLHSCSLERSADSSWFGMGALTIS